MHLKLAILLIFSCIIPVSGLAAPVDSLGISEQTAPLDSVEVSLLTCSPHEEIYSLYGHTALRWHNLAQQPHGVEADYVFNWGMFNFNKPYFVARFVFGLTDYELGIIPYNGFCEYYRRWGSSITEQVLNLTSNEKRQLEAALQENLRPENRVYRYNYFYDNCSTRPRDIIERCIDGQVIYDEREEYNPSYRSMVHEQTRNHPWAAFGNDLLLGVKADFKTSRTEQEFLPQNLMYDFKRAQIYTNGEYRPLIKEERIVVKPGVQMVEEDFPLSPTQCAVLLLLLSLAILVAEWKRGKTYKFWDLGLMTVQGLAGVVIFVMLFSQHPTTSTNLQILLLNPLPLFYLPSVFHRRTKHWNQTLIIMIILFMAGSLWQHYAEGMIILALSLLTRYISNYRHAD